MHTYVVLIKEEVPGLSCCKKIWIEVYSLSLHCFQCLQPCLLWQRNLKVLRVIYSTITDSGDDGDDDDDDDNVDDDNDYDYDDGCIV